MKLEQIYGRHGIYIKNADGSFRNVVDVLEDMFLQISRDEYYHIAVEIAAAEVHEDVFDNSRGRKYEGVKYDTNQD